MKDDTYSGESLLRYQNTPMEQNSNIPHFPREKTLSQADIPYGTDAKPSTVDIMEHAKSPRKKVKSKPEELKPTKESGQIEEAHTPELHHSKQLHDSKTNTVQTSWLPTKFHEIYKLAVIVAGILLLPTHITTQGPTQMPSIAAAPILVSKSSYNKPLEKSAKMEQLWAYHSICDKWNALINPELADSAWRIRKIMQCSRKEIKGNQQSIFFKAQYLNGDKAWLTMDTLRLEDPYLLINHAYQNQLQLEPGFEWNAPLRCRIPV